MTRPSDTVTTDAAAAEQNVAKAAPRRALRACAPFEANALARRLWLDRSVLILVMALVAIALAMSALRAWVGEDLWILPLAAAFATWAVLSSASGRISSQLPRVDAALDQDIRHAESMLSVLLDRPAMRVRVRLLLYHRLATLRHRQQQLPEAVAICRALLQQRMPSQGTWGLGFAAMPGQSAAEVGSIRVHLLLMLTDSCLQLRDLSGAWVALSELHRLPLNTVEFLQRLAMQTHYELLSNQHRQALSQLASKVRFFELMPPAQCGAMHLMLSHAAQALDMPDLKRWLLARAELFTPRTDLPRASGLSGLNITSSIEQA